MVGEPLEQGYCGIMPEQPSLAIRDSDAVYDAQRIFSQHQAIVTIVQARLDDPQLKDYRWLDIACGQGQVLAQLDSNIGPKGRSKIHYHAFDIENEHLRQAQYQSEKTKIRCTPQIGNAADLAKFYPCEKPFDLITCTNAVHELHPSVLPIVLSESLVRLSENGSLFLYDMEGLQDAEFGALTYRLYEVEAICTALCEAFGITAYRPEPGQWKHKTVNAWNIHLQRRLFNVTQENLLKSKEGAITATSKAITAILTRRMTETRQALESLTTSQPETPDDEKAKMALLTEFWALSRAMGGEK